jgi:hypothetical protein
MTSGQEHEWHIELDYMLAKVRHAKEILGRGEANCAYNANKLLEPVLFRLQELCEMTKGEQA